jgi:MSHA pilin protein MshA
MQGLQSPAPSRGFSLVELTAVIVVIAALAAVALPRWMDFEANAKRTVVENVAGTMHSTIDLVRSKARASGLTPAQSNPANTVQKSFIIETRLGASEVDWRNLCPESEAEAGDKLRMLDYLSIRANGSNLETTIGNRSTRVGFDTSNNGCYAQYDSFQCTVSVVDSGCGS